MLINLNSIPEEGKKLKLDKDSAWLQEVLKQKLSELNPQIESTAGKIQIFKTMQNVSLAGELSLNLQPTCARCGQSFDTQLDVSMQRHMVPYFSGPRDGTISEEEEIELSADDLDFSFYRGEEIDLSEIVGEEITLALPIRFLCQEDCKGLCPRCGKNLNLGSCQCDGQDEFSPFSVLKGIKLKS